MKNACLLYILFQGSKVLFMKSCKIQLAVLLFHVVLHLLLHHQILELHLALSEKRFLSQISLFQRIHPKLLTAKIHWAWRKFFVNIPKCFYNASLPDFASAQKSLENQKKWLICSNSLDIRSKILVTIPKNQ